MTKEEIVYKQAQDFFHDLKLRKNLIELQEKIGGLNIFSILKTERAEIRHSNVLAWLIDPFGNHGLGTQFAEVFFINISKAINYKGKFLSNLVFDGLNDITVYREKNNIDMLIVSNKTKRVVAIENKTGSTLHDSRITKIENNEKVDDFVSQLKKYEIYIDSEYSKHEKLFLYLDIKQNTSKNIGRWQCIDYSVVRDTLQYFINSTNLNDRLKIVLEDYLTVVRRNLMNEIDKDTQQLCDSIYSKYREVIDFIIMNKANKKAQFLETVKQLLTDNADELGIIIDSEWSSSSFVRFAVKDMQITSDKDEQWVKEQMLLLEITGNPFNETAIIQIATYLGKNEDNTTIKKINEKFSKGSTFKQWRNYNRTPIKWQGDLDNENSKQELVNVIESILKSKEMQNSFSQIRKVLNEKI